MIGSIRQSRLAPLDALRGVLIALMAIDHASLLVRGVHSYEAWNQPSPVYPDWASFWTRFVTHLCAPGFFFLMGAGLALRGAGRRDRQRVVLRGILLILLEQLLVDPVLYGRVRWTEFGVLSALGAAMMAGAALVSWRPRTLVTAGATLILLCQLPPHLVSDPAVLPQWAHILFLPGGQREWFVLYPLLPWLGIVLLGMAFGAVASQDPHRAYRTAAMGGLGALVAFFLLRLQTLAVGCLTFLGMIKYPPELAFCLLTLGTDAIVIWLLSRAPARWLGPLLVYGRTALVFYLLHWQVLAFLAPHFPPGRLGPMYAAWALAMVVMYPLCHCWLLIKSSQPADSILRLL